jgi:ABC-2 type transport system ATP-binding protein
MSLLARLPVGSYRRRWLVAAGLVVALLIGLVALTSFPAAAGHTSREQALAVDAGPEGGEITLDTTYYLPSGASADDPVPAVLLAHGFGGSKDSVTADATDLAAQGYAVLTWTARGFGASGGRIHLNHPDYEVRDAQQLVDWLAKQPEVRADAPGDPRVGVVGASYGGALALMLAAHDDRVDAIVPSITWHDLARSFLPESTGGDPTAGVFKQAWAGLFFSAGGSAGGLAGLFGGQPPSGQPDGEVSCGRFAEDICAAYQQVAVDGRADAATVARLRESSPASVLDRVSAPTLLIQGTADSLFPLSEADANFAGVAAAGTPVRMAWFAGGHDGGEGPSSERERLRRLTSEWLDFHVAGEGDDPGSSFTWSLITGFSATGRGLATTTYEAEEYPGLDGARTNQVRVSGPPQPVANPAGGTPAAVSSLPSAGGLASFVDGVVTDLPGQHARFVSEPLPNRQLVVGAPTVSLRAASPTGEAVLFVKLYDVDPNGVATLPAGQVAPVRLTGLPDDIADAEPVTVTLPAITHEIEAGHTLRVAVATADQAYAGPTQPLVYRVAVDPVVELPTGVGEPITGPDAIWGWVLAGLLVLVAAGVVGAVLVARGRRRRHRTAVAAFEETPLVVRELRKAYAGGFVAVSHMDLTVERGQVVGLLGPNGAGKTTALRVLLGLTWPTGGDVYIFGHRVTPGAPVLSRVGAMVEGPGLLPHLSGWDNLRAYWRATGRPPADARMDEVVEIAGLGDSIHRRVRTYSHGMKQRLAVAQAMLGMPDLLVLDEPTDGLDPPQIAEMRRVLARYASGPRAVLLSSHLLAEVEQTCSHVVVMHKGEVVAAGSVDEVVGDSPTALVEVTDVATAIGVLDGLAGVRSVTAGGGPGELVVDIDGRPRAEVVEALVRAGIGVERVVPRRRLEDAFLSLVGEDTRGSGDR